MARLSISLLSAPCAFGSNSLMRVSFFLRWTGAVFVFVCISWVETLPAGDGRCTPPSSRSAGPLLWYGKGTAETKALRLRPGFRIRGIGIGIGIGIGYVRCRTCWTHTNKLYPCALCSAHIKNASPVPRVLCVMLLALLLCLIFTPRSALRHDGDVSSDNWDVLPFLAL
ncbi:hypothetical protein P691DRAFT_63521 [Macrolepiota fuliginosa MF-IS2]|uniref:Uncharacterized protein n=1 Tax=Macrolepiota fuliginosa MF-IS2 TaxID=1400762 RepID=A0A9P5XM59_9AGAR|nr:hypothetical protein P691DRAFT_63521 [Macrolepiota fuliginosa MF-IS2]